jgi:PhnB protein
MPSVVQRAVPMLAYEDCGAASHWLGRAFGFREVQRFADPDGRVTHAELELDGAVVAIGWPGPDYQSPSHHAAVCEHARKWLAAPWVIDGALVHVDDLDAHHRRAVDAGATILRGPEDQPFGRLYTAADPEGHRWMFLQTAR